MPDLRVSKQKLAFAAFKKTSAKFNKGTANLQNIPVSKASYLKRHLRSYEKPWQTWWDLSAQLQGDILDCTESYKASATGKVSPKPAVRVHFGPFSVMCRHLHFSALDEPLWILILMLWTNWCCEWSVLRRTDILVFGFYCQLGEWCWRYSWPVKTHWQGHMPPIKFRLLLDPADRHPLDLNIAV